MAAFVHSTAVVDPGAELGQDVKVWHFVHVSEGARIGPGTSLGQGVFVGRGVRVGARVRVQNHVSLFEGVVVEDDVFLGPGVTFTNVRRPRATVSRRGRFEQTLVRRGATLGANATIRCGIELGRHCFVAAGSVVTRDVDAHALVLGNPAHRVGWVCRCAESLPATSEGSTACAACGLGYEVSADACRPRSPESSGGPA